MDNSIRQCNMITAKGTAFSRQVHFRSWFLGSSWPNVPDVPYPSQEVLLASCFGKDLRQDMPEATEVNLVYPKEQWCLRLVIGAVANKADWSWSNSLPGPVWGFHKWKLWTLVSDLTVAPIWETESSDLVSLSALVPIFTLGGPPSTGNRYAKNTPSFMVLAVLFLIHRTDYVQVDTSASASLLGPEVGIRY